MYDFLLKLFKTKENLSYNLKLAFFLTAIISFLSFVFLYTAYDQSHVLKKYLQQATKFENQKQAIDFLNSKLPENLGLTIVILFIIALPLQYYISKLYDLITQKETKPLSKEEVPDYVFFILLAVIMSLLNVISMIFYIYYTNAILDFLSLVYSSSSFSFLS
jgi:flagellar biosynthesis protein FlhB